MRKDLEIVDEQLQLLDDAFAEAQPTVNFREAMIRLRELPPEERRAAFEKLHTTLEANKQRLVNKIRDILVPHQVRRLEQIQLQSQIRRYGLLVTIGVQEPGRQLGITPEQRKKLARVQQQKQREFAEKIEKLHAQATKEVLEEVLTADQLRNVHALLGEPFAVNKLQGSERAETRFAKRSAKKE